MRLAEPYRPWRARAWSSPMGSIPAIMPGCPPRAASARAIPRSASARSCCSSAGSISRRDSTCWPAAVGRLKREDLHLVIAGPDGGYLAETRRFVDEAGIAARTTFTGMLPGPGQARRLRRCSALPAALLQREFRHRRGRGHGLRRAGADLRPGEYLARGGGRWRRPRGTAARPRPSPSDSTEMLAEPAALAAMGAGRARRGGAALRLGQSSPSAWRRSMPRSSRASAISADGRPLRLLIYGLNHAPEPTGIGKFTGEMAAWLAARGHEVRVVTAPPYYPAWRVGPGYSAWRWQREEIEGARVYRCPLYVPAPAQRQEADPASGELRPHQPAGRPLAGTGLPAAGPDRHRAGADQHAGGEARRRLRRCRRLAPYPGFRDRRRLRARYRLRRAGRGASRWEANPGCCAASIGSAASPPPWSPGWPRRAWRRSGGVLFPNWVDTAAIRPAESALRRELGLPPEAVVALYAGNMGEKQGVETLAEVARAAGRHAGPSAAGRGRARPSRACAPPRRAWPRSTGWRSSRWRS